MNHRAGLAHLMSYSLAIVTFILISFAYAIEATSNSQDLLTPSGFKFFPTKLSWDEAKSFCRRQINAQLSGSLAIIRNAAEQEEISNNFKQMSWIGLSRDSNAQSFRWIDNSALIYTNWSPGEPNNMNKNENCVVTNWDSHGRWNDIACSNSFYVICEFRPIESSEISPHGYQFFSISLDWEDAQRFCQSQKLDNGIPGNLAIVRNAEEQEEAVALATAISWIGLRRKNPGGLFFWVNHTPLLFSAWAPNEPNNLNNAENCVVFDTSKSGKWNDISCSNQFQVLCQYDKEFSSNHTRYVSPSRFEYFPDVSLDWQGASLFCRNQTYNDLKGELAIIRSQKEQLELFSFVDHQAWIGLSAPNGDFVWVDGSALSFPSWSTPPFENRYGIFEGCVVFDWDPTNGNWKNIPCSMKKQVICRYESEQDLKAVRNLPNLFRYYKVSLEYDAAVSYCESQTLNGAQGYIATIHNLMEQDYLTTIVKSPSFIGLKRVSQNGIFQWHDKTKIEFTSWAPGEPNNLNEVEGCAEFFPNGNWNDISCATLHAVICRFDSVSSSSASSDGSTTNANTDSPSIWPTIGFVIGIFMAVIMIFLGWKLYHQHKAQTRILNESLYQPTSETDARFLMDNVPLGLAVDVEMQPTLTIGRVSDTIPSARYEILKQ